MSSHYSERELIKFVQDAYQTFISKAAAAKEQHQDAVSTAWLQAALTLLPAFGSEPDLLSSLFAHGRNQEAEAVARNLLVLNPENASNQFSLGLLLQLMGRHQDAIPPYLEAMKIAPDTPSLRNNLAAAYLEISPMSSEAMRLLKDAVETHPDDANAWTNLGKSYLNNFDLKHALEADARALDLQANNPTILSNHSQRAREAKRWNEAEDFAIRAWKLLPDNPQYKFNLAMIHLLRGNYDDGWREHELRWRGSKQLKERRPMFSAPTWQGEPLVGKRLLVWGEQGFGDLFQFCRYIPLISEQVHRQGGHLIWNSFPNTGDLLRRSLSQYADEFSLGGGVESLPSHDYEIPLLSLPYLFGTRENTIPSAVPYLHADDDAKSAWRDRLSKDKRLRVGLTWTGSRTHPRNIFRRVGLERFVDYFRDMKDVAFFSLQPGESAEVAAARTAGLDIVDHTSELETFDDTAAYIGALDLVISVCTSVAHLSGALGQQTWVLLDVNPHWPWLLDRTDSPWYPTATLYRQDNFAEWEPVFDRVKRNLAVLATERLR